ncbi:MAG: LacI family DNA-binding transcriptional regulator [Ilumatobacteraceae bacterium]|nr:LacI family DNA-binding transcriptional regulator [Acidimicrobiaceae bacterium]MBP6486766.1 LacI family DNA-binding transcriptional regulator [Ilumatobacteraceae bacterium]MBP7888475.1 LacI family DNA-binding transcriptional regulator [Ilumatobacteraceae bacterium]MBP8208312.1 LacI family DNA-binding transcriptional regulator [Ilumatobacteraceae bacterium]MBP9052012.1 LacI family DNA-binding transcriptional regulator [Ilumatobacteraceae bacterium]
MPSQAVTLADVAVEAGVHPSTVSRVLSRPQLIGEPTRTAVHAAIHKLGYTPNRAARQLAGGRIGAIGVLVPDITNPFFAHVVRSVQQGCRRNGLTMLLADTDQREADELSEARALAGSVDGFVACSPVAATQQWLQVVGTAPLVFVNRRANGVASVALDQQAIIELGVTHLRAAGHRSIAVVRGPHSYWSSRERDRVVRRLPGLVTYGPVRPDFEAGIALATDLMRSNVTGVLAFNDVQALGIVAGYRAAGRSVPRDLSVVGSDDIADAAMSDPPLTTVAAPVQQLGDAAFDLLARLLAGAIERPEITLPVTLTVRASTLGRSSTSSTNSIATKGNHR